MSPTDPAFGAYSFLPWVRQGLASAAGQTDAPNAPARLELTAVVDIKGGGSTAPVKVRMLGPGDVHGLNVDLSIIRREPPRGTQNFEPNHFPFVEFDPPDVPWLLTPTKATATHRLRPWIVLVVVRSGPGVELQKPDGRPLSVLHIEPPASPSEELPDLAESWAWAHAQLAGTVGAAGLHAALAGPRERTLSRLVCPRRLDAGADYIACVVPAFEVGRLAGLGTPDESATATLAPAWGGQAERDLPVFDHWEFRTGIAGDFESLVRELRPRPVPRGVGTRPLFIGAAGGGLPALTRDTAGAVVGYEGALRAPGGVGDPWPTTGTLAWQAELEHTLERPEMLQASDPAEPLTVAPPIYGRWLAAVTDVPAAQPRWVRDLNLDPRQRAAAGAGTAVVQQQQEQLMEAAWEQAGRIRDANAALRQAQLARAASRGVFKRHVEPLPDGMLVGLAAPVLARVRMRTTTIAREAAASRLPSGALDPVFRRIARPRGPLTRRAVDPADREAIDWLGPLDSATFVPVAPTLDPAGCRPLRKSDEDRLRPRRLRAASGRPGMILLGENEAPPSGQIERGPDSPEAATFRGAAIAIQQRIERAGRLDPPPSGPLGIADVATELRARLDPEVAIAARFGGRVDAPPGWQPADPLEPIIAAPEFPAPMYRPLRDMSQDLLLPGAELLGPNTITVLEANNDFIEAYMVGLNHEMGRELLWRKFPTDQRGTMFRQFWEIAGADPAVARERLYDIPPIHSWDPGVPLGGNATGGTGGRLVLLIRGELLGRYPNAVISAVKATRTGTGPRQLGTEERFPIFHARLHPDVVLLGFDLRASETSPVPDREEALGGTTASPHGWFFVLEQQPTEPRFGLDVGDSFGQTPTDWADLSWSHFAASEEALRQLSHLPVSSGAPATWQIANRKWDSDSATLAWITLQRPVRIAIHADDMIA